MMTILIFSDLHLHTWRTFGKDLKTSLPRRLKDQADILSQIQRIAEAGVDHIEFVGDLFNKVGEVPVEALVVWSKFYADISEPMEFTVGNHDIPERKNPQWFEMLPNAFTNYSREGKVGKYKVRRVGFDERINVNEIKGYDLVLLHKTPIGAKLDSNYEFKDGVDWRPLAENNRLVFFGHIHKKQVLSNNCFVIGAPMHLTFGDKGERGVWLVKDMSEVRFIKLNYPEFRTVDTYDDVPKDDEYNYYRVRKSDGVIEKSNIVGIVVPKVFEERIQETSFEGILREWLVLNEKDESEYLVPLKELIGERGFAGKVVFDGILSKVKIKNFISIGEIEYQVRRGFILVEGRNSSTGGSNGSGKSSAVGEAIFWALFGKTTKGLTGDDVVRRGGKDCKVELELLAGDKVYKVSRSRKEGLKVYIDGQDLYKDMRKLDKQKRFEEEILGFDENLFLASCYFSQERLTALTVFGDAEKTNMITSLLGFSLYDEVYDIVMNELKRIDAELDSKDRLLYEENIKLNHASDTKSIYEGRLSDIDINIQRRKDTLVELKNKVVDIDREIEDLKKMRIEFKDFEEDLKEIDIFMSELRKSRQEVEDALWRVDKEVGREQKVVSSLEGELRYLEEERGRLSDKVSRLRAQELGVRCEYCGSIVTKNAVDDYVSKLLKQIDDIDIQISKKKNDIAFAANVVKGLEDQKAGYYDKIRKIEEKIGKLESEKNDILNERREEEDKIRTNNEKIIRLESEKKSLNDKVSFIEFEIVSLMKDKENTLDNIRDIERQIGKKKDYIKELAEEIKKLNRLKEVFDFWKVAFSNKGIKSLLLDRFCNEFNVILNEYLSECSEGKVMALFSPVKQLKSGEERNKISLEITIDGSNVKYDSLSGGEKRRIDVSVCLALSKWVGLRYGIKGGLLGVVILDELFSYIDRVGEETIGMMLKREGENKTIFVVTHTPDLISWADEVWTVVKRDGVSNLER